MQPKSILPVVRGFMRDYALDALPEGYVWDMKDFIPQRRGARMEGRAAWSYFSPALAGQIWGGYYGRYQTGEKLLVVAGPNIYDIAVNDGTPSNLGASGFASMLQNGVMLRNYVYFFGSSGTVAPKRVAFDGVITPLPASAPTGKVAVAYKDRLVVGKDADIYFSPLETESGPAGTWDALAKIYVTREVTGLAAAPGKLLCFHAGRISRVSGTIPPGTDLDSDMYVDTLTDQIGCTLPGTICYWNENILFADERGVHLTDGAIVKNLTEQGGISDFWREAYANRKAGNSVSCAVYFDYLVVSITLSNDVSFLLLCDLNARAWFRFSNFPAVAMIPSEGSFEEVYAGLADLRLAKTSRMFAGSSLLEEVLPPGAHPADQVDGNGLAVLPSMETGWERLGPEGVIQAKQVFVSYRHQSWTSPDAADAIEVSWRRDPAVSSDLAVYKLAGKLPSVSEYTRKRLPLGGRCYGVQVKVQAVKPFGLFNLTDIGIGHTVGDRGKVTV
jgi:hypothetical protein